MEIWKKWEIWKIFGKIGNVEIWKKELEIWEKDRKFENEMEMWNKWKFGKEFAKWKKNRMEYSMGLFVYYFGTKKKYENVEHHTIKFGDKYKEHLDDIFVNKKLNNDISYYLHRPTATDEAMAPKGHDCFYVLVPVPNNQSNIDWEIEGEKMKTKQTQKH